MTKTALLTLGRLPKSLDIARALSSQGWRVIIAEPAKWHLSRVSNSVNKCIPVTAPNDDQAQYVADLLSIIKREKVELVVPISEEALHATLIEDALPEDVRLFSMPHQQVRLLHDKMRFIELAHSYGLSVPETHLLGTADADLLASTHDYIIKPVCTCSGQGLELCQRGTPLPSPQSRAPSVVQRQLYGAHKSTFSIADSGRVIGSVIYRATVLSGTVAVAFEHLANQSAIESWIETFVGKSNHSGFISFDFIEDDAGTPMAIECNPRVTSGVHFVQPQDLATAITDPEQINDLTLKPNTGLKQFYPCLTETQIAAFKGNGFSSKLKVMLRDSDVNFSWRDPLPLWLMPFTAWGIMKRSFLKGESFGEASTFDIAWYE